MEETTRSTDSHREMSAGHRLAVFVDPKFRPGAVLVDALLRGGLAHPHIESLMVVNTDRSPAVGPARSAARGFSVDLGHRVMNRDLTVPYNYQWITGVAWTARHHALRLLEPPGNDLNAPAFLSDLTTQLKPSLAVVVGSLQIFKEPLLRSIDRIVNYHNGRLPDYRGLRATAWSIYNREKETGFAFHDIVKGIDEGPIVLEGEVSVEPGQGLRRHQYRKTMAAAEVVPVLLDRLVGGANGEPQRGTPRYYSRDDADAMTVIEDPTRHAAAEFGHRLAAFGSLDLSVGGRRLPVTSLTRGRPDGRTSFQTADGAWRRPARLAYLPPVIYFSVVDRSH